MKKIILSILVLSLAACGSLQASATPTPFLQPTPVPFKPTEQFNAQPPATSTASPFPTPDTGLTGLPVEITSLKMVDSRNGWARGNLQGGNPSSDYILRTTDGGSTWQDVTPAGFIRVEGTYFNDFYGGMDALNEKTAWAISTTDFLQGKYGLSGTVWRTDDGGRSWKPGNPIVLAPPSDIFATGDGYRTLQFVDASHGWLVVFVKCGMGISCEEIYQTSDGGMNWRDLSLCWSDNCASPIFIDTTTGWMKYSIPWMPDSPVSNVGALETSPFWKIQKTNNGGTTWNYVSLPPPANLVELLKDSQYSQDNIEFTDTFRRVSPGVVGLRVDYTLRDYKTTKELFTRSYYYLSDNGGQSWSSFPTSGQVFFLNGTTGWQFSGSDGAYVLEKTVDGGTTWQKLVGTLSWNGDIQFTNAEEGWVVLADKFPGQLLHTRDGGLTWTDLQPRRLPLEPARPVAAVTQAPPGALLDIPEENFIVRLDPGTPVLPRTLHMVDANNGWAVGQYGYLFHTSDGGSTWQDVTPHYGVITGKRGFFALDSQRAWTTIAPPPACLKDFPPDACPDYYRSSGPVWFTTDAGQTWHPTAAFPGSPHIFDSNSLELQFVDASTGWAQWEQRDDTGKILEHYLMLTTDGGATWLAQNTVAGDGQIVFTSAQVGFGTEIVLGNGEINKPASPLQDYLDGKVVPVIEKTINGGLSWGPLNLPSILPLPQDIQMDVRTLKLVLPKGLDDWRKSSTIFMCYWYNLQPISATGIGLEYYCDADPISFTEYYLSMDDGQSWNEWFSSWFLNNGAGNINAWILGGGESFLPNGTGWRLFTLGGKQLNLLQKTSDGGKSWTNIQKVAWPYAQFDFANEQVGWAIVTGNTTALIHTNDGGVTWTDLKPSVAP